MKKLKRKIKVENIIKYIIMFIILGLCWVNYLILSTVIANQKTIIEALPCLDDPYCVVDYPLYNDNVELN